MPYCRMSPIKLEWRYDTMTNDKIQSAAEEIHAKVDEDDVSVEEIAAEIQNLTEFSVPFDDAKENIMRQYVDVENVDGGGADEATVVNLEEVVTDGEWVTIEEVKVVQEWDSDSDKVKQTGLIADDTDRLKFIEFAGGDMPTFKEDDVYRIEGAKANEWQGNFSLVLEDETTVERLDDVEIDTENANKVSFMAPIINIRDGSGLIQRCSVEDCTRVVTDRPCPEHGETDGENDLRIKADGDTGDVAHKLIFDRELTEEITGMTMEDAIEIFHDTLSRRHVTDRIVDETVGRYFFFEGKKVGDNVLVDEFEEVSFDIEQQADELLQTAQEVHV